MIKKELTFQMNFIKRLFSTILLIVIYNNVALADDVGINSARLIQLTDTSYQFETDFSQLVIMDFEMPIFPERFTLSAPEFEEEAGYYSIKIIAATSGPALNNKDEILLPWRRNGVGLTVKWLDGTIQQGLYMRSMDGIHLPVSDLMSTEKTLGEVVWESVSIGLNHFRFAYIHLFLIIALIILLPKRKLFLSLVFYAFGQALSMLLFELGFAGFDLLYVDLLILSLVVALVVSVIKKLTFNYLVLLLFIIGLLHGLSVGNELTALDLPLEFELAAIFICNFTIDLLQFGLALILVPLINLVKNKANFFTGLQYLTGILALSVFLGIFMQNVLTGENDVLIPRESDNNAAFTRFAQQNKSQATTRPQVAFTMTNPILSYLSIEPFEVRHEILIKASTALEMLNISTRGVTEIPVDSLASIQDQITTLFAANISLQIDDQNVQEILSNADFVTLGMSGVLIRTEPVTESVDEGIIGISFVYETEALADKLKLIWELFPESLEKVDATTIDPFGGANFVLTPKEPVLNWESTLSGYVVQQVEEVAIESPRLPLLSLFVFILAAILLLLSNKFRFNKNWAVIVLIIGFVLYPFVRSPLDVKFIKQWKPSNERSTDIISGLLTNVYRSFDYRKETDVYDRLAISVIGDQLTHAYISQRKGLEIENRGGAKAKVNDVEVLEVFNVESGMEDNFGIEVEWKVSGSVSHFGHMHYRQNRYRAIIWIVPENDTWKIENIEILDVERLM
jgi:hypothetical protein